MRLPGGRRPVTDDRGLVGVRKRTVRARSGNRWVTDAQRNWGTGIAADPPVAVPQTTARRRIVVPDPAAALPSPRAASGTALRLPGAGAVIRWIMVEPSGRLLGTMVIANDRPRCVAFAFVGRSIDPRSGDRASCSGHRRPASAATVRGSRRNPGMTLSSPRADRACATIPRCGASRIPPDQSARFPEGTSATSSV